MSPATNLRLARKRRERERAAQAAAENRARFGRTKAQKAADRAALEAERTRMQQRQREDSTPVSEAGGPETIPVTVPVTAPDTARTGTP